VPVERSSKQSNQPNREELLNMAIRSARDGNKESARVMLRQVLNEDRRNERAMLWMAQIANTQAERRKWLERVLQVNPDNTKARATLNRMTYKRSARENRTLVIFGMVAGVLVVLLIVVLLAVSLGVFS
jgi:Tfp pilus assembly protein PilF